MGLLIASLPCAHGYVVLSDSAHDADPDSSSFFAVNDACLAVAHPEGVSPTLRRVLEEAGGRCGPGVSRELIDAVMAGLRATPETSDAATGPYCVVLTGLECAAGRGTARLLVQLRATAEGETGQVQAELRVDPVPPNVPYADGPAAVLQFVAQVGQIESLPPKAAASLAAYALVETRRVFPAMGEGMCIGIVRPGFVRVLTQQEIWELRDGAGRLALSLLPGFGELMMGAT